MRTKLRALRVALPIALVAVPMTSRDAWAQQDFPTHPVRLVNPYTPGGSVDLVTRPIAAGLSEMWGQQVIVDNRGGAGTTIGTGIVAHAEPDGYTMLCTSSAIAIMPSIYKHLRFDTLRDLTTIALAVTTSAILAVHPSFPPRTIKELIALAKARPGKVTAASAGTGTTNHLTLEMFKSMAGVDILHVPYKGGGPAITDLISGQVNMFFNVAGTILPHVRAGRVRGIASTGAKRLEDTPDLPTVAEAGVPGFEAETWYALYGPKNLPPNLVRRWNESTNRYLRDPRTQEFFRKYTMTTLAVTPAQAAQYHRRETERWAKVVTAAGIQTQ